jgi:hypothetical protein
MRRNRIERTRPGKAASVIATAVVLLLGTLSPAAVTAKPRALTASELDGVTAGGIRVDAIAFAQASGDHVLAQTISDAFVSTINERELGVGFAEGLAFACCGRESAVAAHSSVSSTGEVVHSESYAVTFRGAIAGRDDQIRYFAYGYAATFLVATSVGDWPDAGEQAVHGPWNHLAGSIGALIDVSPTQGRGGVVSGFEFAPVFAAGLRWRLFRGFLAATPAGSTPAIGNLRLSPMPPLQADRTPLGLLR